MRLLITLLCFFFFCGNVYSQSVQETNSVGYSPWSVNAFSLISAEKDQYDDGGMLNGYNYAGVNYRVNPNERAAFKMAMTMNTSGYDRFNDSCVQTQDAALADPFLEYNVYNLGLFPSVGDVFWSGRVYLPLSKSSRNQNRIAHYRSNTIFTRYVTQDVFFELRNQVDFYHQSKTTYVGTHTEECQIVDNRNPSNTRRYRMDNWVNLWYRINRDFSVGFGGKVREQGYNRTSAYDTSRQRNGRMREISIFMGPSIRYNYSFNLSFILNYQDVVEYSGFHPDRQDDLSELGKFYSKNAEVSLLSFIRF